VLEFLGDAEDRDLRAGAVLPDEVYVLLIFIREWWPAGGLRLMLRRFAGRFGGHRKLLEAAGVEWPGRLGRSTAAPLQNEKGMPGEQLAVDTIYIGGGDA